ncbi:MAG: phage tail protein [Oceanospirillaceae bacterium]|nr:phage tail protein [Oceanospirillaceae bacterium]
MSSEKLVLITTNAGKTHILDAELQGLKLQITHISAGSAGYTPDPEAIALVEEKERETIASSRVDTENHRLDINAVLDSAEEFWVREVGFWSDDVLVYLWSSPETSMTLGYKSGPARFLLGLSLTITDTPLESIEIIDQGQPLELSIRPLEDGLSGEHAEGDTHNFGLPQQHEAVSLVNSDQFEYNAEILRGMGQSGIYMCRQYNQGGAFPWHRPFDVPYAALNIHSHWDLEEICGMGEVSYVANGYYGRSRHNDYRLKQAAPIGSEFLETQSISTPEVPADVARLPANQQVSKMQDYFKVLHGELAADQVENYADAFQWGLSYLEFWFEVFDESLTDTFFSGRHVIDASSIRELLDKVQYFNYGGHKNRLENISYFSSLVRFVDAKGRPRLATMKYRIVVQPVGSLADYPIDSTLQPHEDLKTAHRLNINLDNTEHRAQRFNVRQSLNSDDSAYTRSRELIDTFMEKVPGLDGAGAALDEQYTQYGLNEKLQHWDGGDLNTGYYNRQYKTETLDASNRRTAKRGFNDPSLWVSRTTRAEVMPQKINGGDSFRFSYALPLELILLTPLNKWNPHGVPLLTSADNPSQYHPKKNLTIGRAQENPVPGYHGGSLLYYHTPANFYKNGAITDQDPADTALQDLWMQCSDGTARTHTPSGTPVLLPQISGMDKRIRTRYPIYYQFHEGSHANAELAAYKTENLARFGELQAQINELTRAQLEK